MFKKDIKLSYIKKMKACCRTRSDTQYSPTDFFPLQIVHFFLLHYKMILEYVQVWWEGRIARGRCNADIGFNNLLNYQLWGIVTQY